MGDFPICDLDERRLNYILSYPKQHASTEMDNQMLYLFLICFYALMVHFPAVLNQTSLLTKFK